MEVCLFQSDCILITRLWAACCCGTYCVSGRRELRTCAWLRGITTPPRTEVMEFLFVSPLAGSGPLDGVFVNWLAGWLAFWLGGCIRACRGRYT